MSWRDRIPKEMPKDVRPEGVLKESTELEKMIMRICGRREITKKQEEDLNTLVTIVDKDGRIFLYDSPNDLYEKESLYKEFALNKVQTMRSYGASVGKIIFTLRNYGHMNGWLAYKKFKTPEEVKPVEDQTVIKGGSLPGVKQSG